MFDFIPSGFWAAIAMIGMIIFLVFGLDLLIFRARVIALVGRIVNKRFQVDQMIMNALGELKKTSDREFNVEHSIMTGWGRFVMSGLLLFGAALLMMFVLPAIK